MSSPGPYVSRVPVRIEGVPSLILATCADERGSGGLYAIADGGAVSRVDNLNTTSVCMHGDTLYRLLWSHPGEDAVMLRYRKGSPVRVTTLPGCGDAHQILSCGEELVLIKTWQNAIAWLTPDLRVVREWQACPDEDAWHLNSATMHEGRLIATAFGRFDSTRG